MADMPEFDLTNGQLNSGLLQRSTVHGYSNRWATAGFFGRLNYDYQGRYLAEANIRYDGTSRFRRGNRWQWSPSFSLGWNIATGKVLATHTKCGKLAEASFLLWPAG